MDVVNDDLLEFAEQFTIEFDAHSFIPSGVQSASPSSTTVTINDDEGKR